MNGRDVCFDNQKYLKVQIEEILNRAAKVPLGGNVYIEFGGKAYDDQHAARVLPGYDPHNKVHLLKELAQTFEIVVAVSARDILKPRIRGDSQLFYDLETIRVIRLLRDECGIIVRHGIVTMFKRSYSSVAQKHIMAFIESAEHELGILFNRHGYIDNYPSLEIAESSSVFLDCPKINVAERHILVFSPGGGSGKFGVCLSQLVHDFRKGKNSLYLKFETFPVFKLSPEHPVNVAFLAATADLNNTLLLEEGTGLTTYDKDFENFNLLKLFFCKYCPNRALNPISSYKHPSDMGVNRLTDGFTNEDGICRAAIIEIQRRIERYRDEIRRRIEYENTLTHLDRILPLSLRYMLDD